MSLTAAVVAADTVAAWAEGTVTDLRPYDTALRSILGPALDRLSAVARVVELFPTAAVLALRSWPPILRAASDVVIGRGAWALDARVREARRAIRSGSSGAALRWPGRPRGVRRGDADRIEVDRGCRATS